MIFEVKRWHALSQRISDHQLSTYNSMTTFLSFTISLMAKYLMSMCLLRLPLLLPLAIKTTTELSQKIFEGLEIVSTIFSLEMKFLSYTLCDVALKQETNSASMVEVAVKVCLTLYHEITPPTIMKMYPDVDLPKSTHPAKSEFK